METLIIPANDKLLSTGMSSPRKTIWARYGTCVTSGSSRHSSVSPHPPSALHHMPFSCPLLVFYLHYILHMSLLYPCLLKNQHWGSDGKPCCLHFPLFPSLISPVPSTTPPPWGQAEPVSVRGGEGGWWILLAWGIRLTKYGRAERTSPAVSFERGQPDTPHTVAHKHTHVHICQGWAHSSTLS